ncbi:MAG: ABC transporter permease, partial [Geodermatophilaceae bacterium]|nr:ABC transporter permease [Geodermatophilaceae bacterium]
YGIPVVQNLPRVILAFTLGMATMVVLGVVLGLASRTARSAQALGMLAFLPMWLLGGGGPPVGVLSDAMKTAADLTPLSHVTAAIREPWLGTGTGWGHLGVLVGFLAVGLAVVAVQLRRRPN